ncbi:uncharacterized protein LOC130499642 [Raphanus sativus]|uniref:Uncharacterized protein LOC130499642 n=1 Tax=Raphanus sativus TaxID=3726 RepID=A0A9W3CE25_RAPSA|nr:uncharacterized protein LOC130499642 [Raphanus sativus]
MEPSMELLGEMQQYKPRHHVTIVCPFSSVFSQEPQQKGWNILQGNTSRLCGVVCKPIVYSHTTGSDHVENDRHVEEEAQPIRNSLRMIASKLDVLPGDEFRVAYEETVKFGSHVIVSAGNFDNSRTCIHILNLFS